MRILIATFVWFHLFACAGMAADRLVFTPPNDLDNGKRVVLISGDEEYRGEESCPMLAKILSQTHGFHCTVLFPIDKQTGGINPYEISNIPGTESLDDADLMVLGTRWRTLPDEQLRPILDFLKSGKPLIVFRTATHAFKSGNYGGFDWANFGLQVVGENWHSHHGKHKVEGGRSVVVAENAKHPILNSVESFYMPSDIYGIENLDQEAATVLLRGQILVALDPAAPPLPGEKNDPMMPLAWLKDYQISTGEGAGQTGQVFTTTAGAAVDFRSPDLRRLIVNASFYLTGLEVPTKADVEFIDPFEPSFFGFVTADDYLKRDLRVEEFELGSSASFADGKIRDNDGKSLSD